VGLTKFRFARDPIPQNGDAGVNTGKTSKSAANSPGHHAYQNTTGHQGASRITLQYGKNGAIKPKLPASY